MSPNPQNLHFVHETKPGTALDPSQTRALRSHVRKVNLSRSFQKSSGRLENFRSLTLDDFSMTGRGKGSPSQKSSRSTDSHDLEAEGEDLPLQEDDTWNNPLIPSIAGVPTEPTQPLLATEAQSSLNHHCRYCRANPSHPSGGIHDHNTPGSLDNKPNLYSSVVAGTTGVEELRIEQILNSCTFQLAVEPLSSLASFNGDLTALSVFPDCLSSPAFLYALLYSILHYNNHSQPTDESLRFKDKAIECLRADLDKDDPTTQALSIGTILVLAGAAYHCGELAESTAHSQGLYRLLEHCHASSPHLQHEALRVIFWRRLFGCMPFSDEQCVRLRVIQDLLETPPGFQHSVQPYLPSGFRLYEDVIHDGILNCVRMHLTLQGLTSSEISDPEVADSLQAHIEVRLAFRERSCKEHGPIAECCRIAVYIVSYVSASATWKSVAMPLRLAGKLLTCLEETTSTDVWRYRRDLFLWLLFVGAAVSRGTSCFAIDLASRYQAFIQRIIDEIGSWRDLWNGPKTVHSVLQDYVYATDWIAQRRTIPCWNDLERTILWHGSEDVGADIGQSSLT